ncbi:hypothetical protein FNV43_RR22389 [Rhamnella rubrinervis]|uniref:Uncharacterized protein n=1 Tax=Rhamnella rubrinervis TaxID=2594499 RepID=A0A8K0DQ45_9ROSA|nr:hypothetical protein FNV43_RR22389 [Rhamnella rubrinervis]
MRHNRRLRNGGARSDSAGTAAEEAEGDVVVDTLQRNTPDILRMVDEVAVGIPDIQEPVPAAPMGNRAVEEGFRDGYQVWEEEEEEDTVLRGLCGNSF